MEHISTVNEALSGNFDRIEVRDGVTLHFSGTVKFLEVREGATVYTTDETLIVEWKLHKGGRLFYDGDALVGWC